MQTAVELSVECSQSCQDIVTVIGFLDVWLGVDVNKESGDMLHARYSGAVAIVALVAMAA